MESLNLFWYILQKNAWNLAVQKGTKTLTPTPTVSALLRLPHLCSRFSVLKANCTEWKGSQLSRQWEWSIIYSDSVSWRILTCQPQHDEFLGNSVQQSFESLLRWKERITFYLSLTKKSFRANWGKVRYSIAVCLHINVISPILRYFME